MKSFQKWGKFELFTKIAEAQLELHGPVCFNEIPHTITANKRVSYAFIESLNLIMNRVLF